MLLTLAFAAAAALSARDAGAALHADVLYERGAKLFRLCSGCHSLQPGETVFGPTLYGITGRRAARVEGFPYSPALRESGILWNEWTLDRWLADPQRFVPGSRMPFPGLPEAEDRAAVIDYLKAASE